MPAAITCLTRRAGTGPLCE